MVGLSRSLVDEEGLTQPSLGLLTRRVFFRGSASSLSFVPVDASSAPPPPFPPHGRVPPLFSDVALTGTQFNSPPIQQTESMVPAQQFIPILHKDGSIDTLRDLLTSLANRLQWRSNQGDPLFPPAAAAAAGHSPEARPADDNELRDIAGDVGADAPPPAGAGAGAASAAVAATEADSANERSDDDDDDDAEVALSLPDAVLARAVLCPSGVVVATARRIDRRKNTADGAGGGGGGGGAGGADDHRWRREVRALAEGHEGTITVGEGAAAVDRVLREIKAWEVRGGGTSIIHTAAATVNVLFFQGAPLANVWLTTHTYMPAEGFVQRVQ